jgi:hypothetical protein
MAKISHSFIPISAGIIDDDKVYTLPAAAFRLYITAIVECWKRGTDGRITWSFCSGFRNWASDRKHARTLVSAGLWIRHPGDGWEVANYRKYNPRKPPRGRKTRAVAPQSDTDQQSLCETVTNTLGTESRTESRTISTRFSTQTLEFSQVSMRGRTRARQTDINRTTKTPVESPGLEGPRADSLDEGPIREQLPAGWVPSRRSVRLAGSLRLDPAVEADRFRDWSTAGGASSADWDAAFRTWLRRGADHQRQQDRRLIVESSDPLAVADALDQLATRHPAPEPAPQALPEPEIDIWAIIDTGDNPTNMPSAAPEGPSGGPTLPEGTSVRVTSFQAATEPHSAPEDAIEPRTRGQPTRQRTQPRHTTRHQRKHRK